MSSLVSADQLKELLKGDSKPVLIDVREPHEFLSGNIPGSENIPLAQLSDAFSEYDMSAKLVFICQSGKRSLQASNFATSLGYSNSLSLQDGIQGWTKHD